MDFARKQLMKFGWEEGKGLGKNENGISTALKPKLKFDNAGIGHDSAEQFTYHWWENVFNEAANNINVSAKNGVVSVNTKSKDVLNITSSKYTSKHKNQNLKYGSFIKTSKLTETGVENIKEVESDSSDDEIKTKKNSKGNNGITSLTDEELFAICGGRTAHKGARHGLKLNGKLARIEQQEREILNKMSETKEPEVPVAEKLEKIRASERFLVENGFSHEKTKRKKRKKKNDVNSVNVFEKNEPTKRKNEEMDFTEEVSDDKTVSPKKRKLGVSEYEAVVVSDKKLKNRKKKERKKRKKVEKKVNVIVTALNGISLAPENK